ncbi:MAG: AAA family ATPase, partial [Planctomycetota bacterium]|nr:AAA family ATPase [Planctomycetota bacterium]
GLARCVSESVPDVRVKIHFLRGGQNLRKRELIRPCGGQGHHSVTEDDSTLRFAEFELTDEFLDSVKVKRQRQSQTRAKKSSLRFEQLVLSEDVRQSLDLAIAQVRHSKVLLDDWGIGEVFSYGRGVGLLFSGPPGVGKTASAKAMAHELGKPILVADYSAIQNCWVGETEKNIVRTFRQATQEEAVLFWDEADAMFYDRDLARAAWEIRDVNVLLQEIEKFEGVCILSTNRKISLDRALERRIAVKVEFHEPDRDQRKQIWEKLLPPKMPRENDVQAEELCDAELTGGEIKNAVLNAARFALARDPKGKVALSDFRKAIEKEEKGRWCKTAGKIGFLSE